jgi:hypothetical protein
MNNKTGMFLLFAVTLMLSGCLGGGSTNFTSSHINFTSGQAASVVVGQADFATTGYGTTASTLSSPSGNVDVDNSELFIGDYSNDRTVVFNNVPTTNGASADYAIGQADLTTNDSTTIDANTSQSPQDPMVSGGKLFVAEYNNNRVSIYNTVPTASPGTIDVVLGQPDKGSNGNACSASGLNNPAGIAVVGGKIVVVDHTNHRVLIWNSIPTSDGQAADLVLGQTDFTSCTLGLSDSTMQDPAGVWTDGTRLVVVDSTNSRVLIWNTFPTTNGQAADLVLGQPDFTSGTGNQGITPDATTMLAPYGGVYVLNNQLFVTDTGNNRVLVWNTFPTTNDQAADAVLGQPDFASNSANQGTTPDATTLDFPTGVFAIGKQLFVTDQGNNRVLIYNGT